MILEYIWKNYFVPYVINPVNAVAPVIQSIQGVAFKEMVKKHKSYKLASMLTSSWISYRKVKVI